MMTTVSRDFLAREHGRLAARLKRYVRRYERGGKWSKRAMAAIAELMMVERMMLLSDLELAALARSPERLVEFVPPPSRDELAARIRLMAPGAGLEVPVVRTTTKEVGS